MLENENGVAFREIFCTMCSAVSITRPDLFGLLLPTAMVTSSPYGRVDIIHENYGYGMNQDM